MSDVEILIEGKPNVTIVQSAAKNKKIVKNESTNWIDFAAIDLEHIFVLKI